tara:strand:- start:361 stop:1299 length:939 start_codon:yes stop_codon:yes gene_type:complete
MAKKKPQILKEIQNKELPEVNYAYQKSISYSQMSMYRSCPHKWALQYKEGHYNNDPNIHFTFGTSMHEVIQDWLTVLYEESGVKADEINLEEQFQEKFISLYQEEYKKFNNTHYSSPEELREFFEDGVAILDFIKKRRNQYFSKRGWHLAGIELPIVMNVGRNLMYKGFIDLVLYHEPTNKFYIYDIKTSTRGWNAKAKSDETKQMQLVLYKKFFNEQYGIPLENIEVEFFIVRRKVWENSDYPIYRVQQHRPAAGRNKLSKADKILNEFITECFTPKGKYQEKEHPKVVSSLCKWCAFNDDKNLCNKNMSS